MPLKLIRKTVKGENLFGRIANKIIPFPRVRDAIGAVIKGTKQGLPLPELEEAKIEAAVREAKEAIETAEGQAQSEGQYAALINQVYDILDDGKDNDSRALPAGTVKIITQISSAIPVLAYLFYAITTGDFNLTQLMEYIGVI